MGQWQWVSPTLPPRPTLSQVVQLPAPLCTEAHPTFSCLVETPGTAGLTHGQVSGFGGYMGAQEFTS